MRLLAVVILATLSGCSLFAPKFEAPKLSVVDIQLLKGNLWHQDLKVRMRVQNPNDRKLPVKGLWYTLEVGGQELAHGESAASFVVPAQGEAEFDMTVSANMAGAVVNLLGRGSDTSRVNYRLVGKVSLSEGLLRSIPFDENGTFKLQ